MTEHEHQCTRLKKGAESALCMLQSMRKGMVMCTSAWYILCTSKLLTSKKQRTTEIVSKSHPGTFRLVLTCTSYVPTAAKNKCCVLLE